MHTRMQYGMEYHKTRYKDVLTMNVALIGRFLSLICAYHTTEYSNHFILNPAKSFQSCFRWFIDQHGNTNENNHKENKVRMKVEWSLQDRWTKLE